MATGNITEKTVTSLSAQAKREERTLMLWDKKLRGFGARASKTGRVAWLFQYWLGDKDGQAKRLTIGDTSFMDVDAARTEAERLRGELNASRLRADDGVQLDLVARRKSKRVQEREALEAPTLKDSVDLYFKRNAEPGRYWDELRQRFDRQIIPHFKADTKVAKITKAEVRHFIETKEETHQAAARMHFATLRPFFKWCVERDLMAVSPMATLATPEVGEARDRVLTDKEVKAFWQATVALSKEPETDTPQIEPSPIFAPFYRLLLLTAQRRDEVAGIRWSELDLDACTWTIPRERAKNDRAHLVHLSPQAMAVIAKVPKVDKVDFLFSTTGKNPISGFAKPKARLDTLMQESLGKLDPWRVHDLRRTAATGMQKLGFQLPVVEWVLNHVSGSRGGLAGIYQRHEYLEERKKALEAWGTYVDSLIADRPMTANVVPLRG